MTSPGKQAKNLDKQRSILGLGRLGRLFRVRERSNYLSAEKTLSKESDQFVVKKV